MGFNPLKEKGVPPEKQIANWNTLNQKPYDKKTVHPYTRCRVIVMNGAEMEAGWFLHHFARHNSDKDLQRFLAMGRRVEMQQQKLIAGLVPSNESNLEVTIGYEQVAVDLTAWLARKEPDPMVRAVFDFGLLEDFDHLYRYANLMEMIEGVEADTIVGKYTEVMPGRPTKSEHRHPFDDIRLSYDAKKADILTQLQVMTLVAAEQQTMNYYTTVGNRLEDETGRGLYQEIAMIEEQHVSQYESLLDANADWFTCAVMHEYCECYLYHSFMEQEVDKSLKKVWEMFLDMEIGHLHAWVSMAKKHLKKDPSDQFPDELPEALMFEENVEYVRKVLAEQVDLTADRTEFKPVNKLPKNHTYFEYQKMVNDSYTPSQEVIERYIKKNRKDWRHELQGEHPVERFRDRTKAVL